MNTIEAIKIIKNSEINVKDSEDKIHSEMKDIISEITDKFQNPENISEKKYDMSETLQAKGIDKELYKKKFGSVQRSEVDSVLYLAKTLLINDNALEEKPKQPKAKNEKTLIEETINDLENYLEIIDSDDKNQIQVINQSIADLKNYLEIL